MAEREPEVPEERRIRFRIGINLGDVIAEEHDIFGDGANVAARLEGLAEPGGICVSRIVRDQVRDRLGYAYEDLGKQGVKNIARPVRVYAVHSEGTTGTPRGGVSSAASSSPPVAVPRLSIVVLPFTNLSNDPEQQCFTDGITEDVTTDLSRIPHMFVISRNTAFAYQGKRVDTKQIGPELGARYVLEGSVRRLGNRVRVNAQLIDAESDAHLWAQRFDRDFDDRPNEHPDVLDYILRGRAARFKPYSHGVYLEAVGLFGRALKLDPRSVEAQSRLAIALAGGFIDSMTDSAELDILRAEGLTAQALAASPRSPLPHRAKGTVLRARRRYAEAIPEYESVRALDRNDVSALPWPVQALHRTDRRDHPANRASHQLSPHNPELGFWYQQIGMAHLLQSRTEDAILWLEKARDYVPAYSAIHRDLAAAYALRGEIERAAAELTEARRLSSDDR
jgi:adenylate cyclase